MWSNVKGWQWETHFRWSSQRRTSWGRNIFAKRWKTRSCHSCKTLRETLQEEGRATAEVPRRESLAGQGDEQRTVWPDSYKVGGWGRDELEERLRPRVGPWGTWEVIYEVAPRGHGDMWSGVSLPVEWWKWGSQCCFLLSHGILTAECSKGLPGVSVPAEPLSPPWVSVGHLPIVVPMSLPGEDVLEQLTGISWDSFFFKILFKIYFLFYFIFN